VATLLAISVIILGMAEWTALTGPLVHFAIFFPWTLSLCWCWRDTLRWRWWTIHPVLIAASALSEWIQRWFPIHCPTLGGFAMNFLGIVPALILAWFVGLNRPPVNKHQNIRSV